MAYFRKLPSGKWQAQVWHPSGKQITKSDPLKSVVRDWARDNEAAIRRGDWVDPRAGKMTVAAWYERCARERLIEVATKKKLASAWNAHVEPKWATWPLNTIRYEDCKTWIAEMSEKKTRAGKQLGADMIGVCGRLLGHLLDEAVKAKRIPANPMRLVKLPSPPKHEDRVLTRGEEQRLYRACDELFADTEHEVWPEFKAFLQTLLGTGLRFQEVAGLLRENVNPLRKTITVGQVLPRDTRELRRDGKTPAATGRTVPITPELAKVLAEQMSRHLEDLVFVSADDRKPLHYNNVRTRHWVKVVKRASLAGLQPTMHDLRHTYGSRLADRGVPPHEIAALMGHARLASVERYLHASEQRMERARAALAEPDAVDSAPSTNPGAAPSAPGQASAQ